MLIGWIMELIAVCSAHWVILSTYDRNSYNQLVVLTNKRINIPLEEVHKGAWRKPETK
jgi:hypothetical protein